MSSVIAFKWDAEREVMEPLPRFREECRKTFENQHIYRMEEIQARSEASHRAFFASLNEAWANLPDELAQEFTTAESLRKYALIKSGHCNQHTFSCATRAEALRLSAFLKPLDEFGVIRVNGATVTRYVAHSQSYRAMDKETFRKSFDDVLRIVAEMIGTSVKTLDANAGKSA